MRSSAPLGDERYKEFAGLAHTATRRMLALCDHLLASSFGQTAKKQPVGALLSDLVKLFGPMAEERGVKLSLELPDDLPEAQVDPEPFTSAVNNLVSNAIKFTPKGGKVTVMGRKEPMENVAILVISDTGFGMEPETVARQVRDGGEKGAANTVGLHGDFGSGMGLEIARRAVAVMGGSIEFDSRPGVGTTAIVRLPLG